MKKLFLIAAAAFSLCHAFAQSTGYKITGKADFAKDGDKVYIADMQYFDLIPTDSTVIKDKKFFGSSQNVVRHIPLLYKTFTVSNLKEALP